MYPQASLIPDQQLQLQHQQTLRCSTCTNQTQQPDHQGNGPSRRGRPPRRPHAPNCPLPKMTSAITKSVRFDGKTIIVGGETMGTGRGPHSLKTGWVAVCALRPTCANELRIFLLSMSNCNASSALISGPRVERLKRQIVERYFTWFNNLIL